MSSTHNRDHVLIDLVEPLNRHFHVPVAARLVTFLIPTPMTPNQVTAISVLFGLAAAWAFSQATLSGMIVGGALLEVSLILDCVDGQLARAKNLSSDLGRLIDGIGGYVANLGVVAGIAWGYPETRITLAALTVLTIIRAIAYDYCKQEMTTLIQDGYDWSRAELEKVERQIEHDPVFILRLYRTYLNLQRRIFRGSNSKDEPRFCWNVQQRNSFYEANRSVLGLWKWNGPDLVFFLMALSALAGLLETLLLPITLLVAVQLILMLWLHQSRIRYETDS